MTGDQAFGQVFKWNAVDQIGLMRQTRCRSEQSRLAMPLPSAAGYRSLSTARSWGEADV
jgi:hypothetical protein